MIASTVLVGALLVFVQMQTVPTAIVYCLTGFCQSLSMISVAVIPMRAASVICAAASWACAW